MPTPAHLHPWARTAAILASGVTVLGLVGCASSSPGSNAGSLADMEPITLTWAEQGTETGAIAVAAHTFIDYVTEHTDGKVSFEVYWGSSLFPATETLASVGAGVADVGQFSSPYNPDDLPAANYLLKAGVKADRAYPLGALQSSAATYEMFQINEDLAAEFRDENNVVVLEAGSTGRYAILCRDEVSTPEQAVGKRTRVGGGAWISEAEALGMATQFTPPLEIYEALQRGVLDCAVLTTQTYADWSLWEVAKHYVPAAFSPFNGSLRVINADVWDSFPDDLKQIFLDAGAHAVTASTQAALEAFARFVAEGPDYDIQFHDPAGLNSVLLPHQEQLLAGLASEAPGAVSDGAAFLAEYDDYLEKWKSLIEGTGFASAGEDQTITANAVDAPNHLEMWESAFRDGLLEIVAGRYFR